MRHMTLLVSMLNCFVRRYDCSGFQFRAVSLFIRSGNQQINFKNQKHGLFGRIVSSPCRSLFTSQKDAASWESITVNYVQNYLRDKVHDKYLSTTNSVHDVDYIQNDGIPVMQILTASKELLELYDAPEPTESVCHLLAFTLKNEFQWEDNGFAVLMRMLTEQDNHKLQNIHALKNVRLTSEEFQYFSSMLTRRIQREPLQYIIGKWDFHNIVLKIRPPCLCPRPETEELVEYVKEDIKRMIRELREKGIERKLKILDVGCGTGAIGIALAHLFPKDLTVVAIDIAKEAVSLSNENAEWVLSSHQMQSTNRYIAILSSAKDFSSKTCGTFDMVVSNPPYIPSKDMDTLTQDVIGYEDYNALCGGEDGLNVVRDICSRLQEWCCNNSEFDDRSFKATCWMELDSSHPSFISSFLETEFPYISVIKSLKDMSGLDRFVQLQVQCTQRK